MAEQIDIISQNTQSTVIAEFERQDKETAEMIYAVIDTNVFVAALLSRHSDSATVLVINVLLNRGICPFLCTQNKNKCGFLLVLSLLIRIFAADKGKNEYGIR